MWALDTGHPLGFAFGSLFPSVHRCSGWALLKSWLGRRQQMAHLTCSFCFASEQAVPGKENLLLVSVSMWGCVESCSGTVLGGTWPCLWLSLCPHTQGTSWTANRSMVRMRGCVPSTAPQSISQFLSQMPSLRIFWQQQQPGCGIGWIREVQQVRTGECRNW